MPQIAILDRGKIPSYLILQNFFFFSMRFVTRGFFRLNKTFCAAMSPGSFPCLLPFPGVTFPRGGGSPSSLSRRLPWWPTRAWTRSHNWTPGQALSSTSSMNLGLSPVFLEPYLQSGDLKLLSHRHHTENGDNTSQSNVTITANEGL